MAEVVVVPRVAGARQLHLPRRARLRAGRRRAARRRPAPAWGCSTTRRARRTPSRWRVETLDPSLRERALGGELLLVSKTNRLSPVHRRARMDYVGIRRVSSDGEIVGEARLHRPLHDQGLRRAGVRDARPAPQAAADPGQRGPDRRLARLQGGGLALRVLPQGRALRRAHRRPARRGRRAAGPAGRRRGACSGRRDADGRSASIIVALPKGGYDAALLERLRAFLRRRFDASTVDAHEVLAEGDRVRVHFTIHRAQGGLPELSRRDARGRDPRARAHVGRPRARRARRAPRRGARAHAGQALDPAPARLLQGGRRPVRGGRRHRALRAPVHRRRGLPRAAAQRARRAHAHRDVPAWAARSSSPRRMPTLEHLGLRVVEERPTRLLGGDGALWLQDFGVLGPDRPAARPRGVRRPRRASASPPSGAARPSRTR